MTIKREVESFLNINGDRPISVVELHLALMNQVTGRDKANNGPTKRYTDVLDKALNIQASKKGGSGTLTVGEIVKATIRTAQKAERVILVTTYGKARIEELVRRHAERPTLATTAANFLTLLTGVDFVDSKIRR